MNHILDGSFEATTTTKGVLDISNFIGLWLGSCDRIIIILIFKSSRMLNIVMGVLEEDNIFVILTKLGNGDDVLIALSQWV